MIPIVKILQKTSDLQFGICLASAKSVGKQTFSYSKNEEIVQCSAVLNTRTLMRNFFFSFWPKLACGHARDSSFCVNESARRRVLLKGGPIFKMINFKKVN